MYVGSCIFADLTICSGPGGGAAQTFGAVLSLSETGSTLAVGTALREQRCRPHRRAVEQHVSSDSGAVWLYRAFDDGTAPTRYQPALTVRGTSRRLACEAQSIKFAA